MSLSVKISGTGSYLPDKILSNEDLEKIVSSTTQTANDCHGGGTLSSSSYDVAQVCGSGNLWVSAPCSLGQDLCVGFDPSYKLVEDLPMSISWTAVDYFLELQTPSGSPEG